nr:13785_t:CDS:10 [Entrophospora candida]
MKNSRKQHSTTSILIDSKLYFFGGIGKGSNDIESCINQILLLDLSNSFNNNDIPWTDLTSQITSNNTPQPLSYCWSSIGDSNKIIYLFGNVGREVTSKTSNINGFVNAFDPLSKQWEKPVIDGVTPEQRILFQAVNDNQNAKIYIFGGSSGFNGTTLLNDMNVLNTNSNNSLSWESIIFSNKDKPPLWSDYTATLLSNGNIIYIGGKQMIPGSSVISFAQMNEIWVYDTKKAVWKKNIATGINPDVRIGHSAVLGNSNDGMEPATPNLIVLNTSNFQWSEPKISNQSPSALAYHSATLINNQMIITFGNTTTGPSSDIYILDISLPSEYKWTSSYNLNLKTPFILPKELGTIIGVTVGGVFSITTITVVTVLLYKKWKKLQQLKNTTSPLFSETPPPDYMDITSASTTPLRTPSSSNNNNNISNYSTPLRQKHVLVHLSSSSTLTPTKSLKNTAEAQLLQMSKLNFSNLTSSDFQSQSSDGSSTSTTTTTTSSGSNSDNSNNTSTSASSLNNDDTSTNMPSNRNSDDTPSASISNAPSYVTTPKSTSSKYNDKDFKTKFDLLERTLSRIKQNNSDIPDFFRPFGIKQKVISAQLDIPTSTINDTIKQYKETGYTTPEKRPGCPKLLAQHDTRILQHIVHDNWFSPLGDITNKFNSHLNTTLHYNTVRKYLHDEGLGNYATKKKPLLAEKQ